MVCLFSEGFSEPKAKSVIVIDSKIKRLYMTRNSKFSYLFIGTKRYFIGRNPAIVSAYVCMSEEDSCVSYVRFPGTERNFRIIICALLYISSCP